MLFDRRYGGVPRDFFGSQSSLPALRDEGDDGVGER